MSDSKLAGAPLTFRENDKFQRGLFAEFFIDTALQTLMAVVIDMAGAVHIVAADMVTFDVKGPKCQMN